MKRRLLTFLLLLSADACRQPALPQTLMKYRGSAASQWEEAAEDTGVIVDWTTETDSRRLLITGYCEDPLGRSLAMEFDTDDSPPTAEDYARAEAEDCADHDACFVHYPHFEQMFLPLEGTAELWIWPRDAHGRYDLYLNCGVANKYGGLPAEGTGVRAESAEMVLWL